MHWLTGIDAGCTHSFAIARTRGEFLLGHDVALVKAHEEASVRLLRSHFLLITNTNPTNQRALVESIVIKTSKQHARDAPWKGLKP